MSVKEDVTALVQPIVESLGYELVEVTYQKNHDSMALTVFIDSDKEGGISLDDTEIVANAIDAPLDELDPTNGAAYVLNVSSPGLDRPLKTERDFVKKIGTEIELSLYAPINGSKKHIGTLLGYENEIVTVKNEKGTIQFNIKDIAVAKPYINF